MRIRQVSRIIGGSLATAVLVLVAQAPAFGAESAVWVQTKINFIYQGFTTTYSCQGLEDTMRYVLAQLGARESDMKLRQTGCSRGPNAPSSFPGVNGTFYRLEPASSATGGESQAAAESAQPAQNSGAVPAEWQTVNVSISRSGRDAPGTCELIDLVHKKVLPLFPARNVKFQSTCFPHTQLVKGSTLQVDVLKPASGSHVASAAE